MTKEKLYKTSEVAKMMSVTNQTVYKWISCDILPVDGWFKLPNGYIRFRAWLVEKLISGEM